MGLGSALLRVRGKNKSAVTVMLVISHPMHTGTQKNKKTGQKIPAHYITDVDFYLNGNKFASLEVGPAISKNPFFKVYLKGPASGTLKVEYKDNKGKKWTKTKNL